MGVVPAIRKPNQLSRFSHMRAQARSARSPKWMVPGSGSSGLLSQDADLATVLHIFPSAHWYFLPPGLDLLGTGEWERLLSSEPSHRWEENPGHWSREAEVRPRSKKYFGKWSPSVNGPGRVCSLLPSPTVSLLTGLMLFSSARHPETGVYIHSLHVSLPIYHQSVASNSGS